MNRIGTYQPSHWSWRQDAEGVIWASLDVVDAKLNTLSQQVLWELDELLTLLEGLLPSAVIFTSSKASGFIAGADIHEFKRLKTPDQARQMIAAGQQVFDRLAELPCPSMALIHGHCLGGGLEMALACQYRLAIDDPATRLGLPEVKLGIHPGFGGSLRSTRLLGSRTALQLMLSGRSIGAHQAKRLGLVDEVVPRQFCEHAVQRLLSQPMAQRNRQRSQIDRSLEALLGWYPVRQIVARRMRRQTARRVHPDHYPAPFALIDLWRRASLQHPQQWLAEEAASVAGLIVGESAQNLVRVFELQEQLKAQGNKACFQPRHVHVLGAGTMGADIAAWSALHGFITSIEDPNLDALGRARQKALGVFHKRFKDYPAQAQAATDRLLIDPEGIGRGKADVVIEAVFEDVQAKQSVFAELEKTCAETCLLASNTSSIPLASIGAQMVHPERLIGLHFFNPVTKMSLVEVVYDNGTPESAIEQGLALCRHFDKLPLRVRSSPGFLVNRVLMPYLLCAFQLYGKGVPAEKIDRSATAFGMPIGPLALADQVGLDVCLQVARALSDTLQLDIPAPLEAFVEAGRNGRKSGWGVYRHSQHNAKQGQPAAKPDPDIERQLMSALINEAKHCLEEQIVATADEVDAGVIFGTGFAPFRGGPLHARLQ